MTRVLSGAVLIAVAVSVVWFAPPWLFFATAELLLLLAFIEYARLADACGFPVPRIPAAAATMLSAVGVSSTFWVNGSVVGTAVFLDVIVMSAFVLLGSIALVSLPGGRIDRDTLGRAGTATFPMLYLGLPIGALISLRAQRGREALFLLMLAVMVSDTAQYYAGRAFGRRLLAPAISPKKTIEGAIGGFLFGGALVGIVGAWWLPEVPTALRVALGATVVALGIAGDLFESMLKRSAGVKDSSSLIPGHGGVLDRIDALLFAAPVYYIVLKYV
jgi:phosphatidate cytidylyltransferase